MCSSYFTDMTCSWSGAGSKNRTWRILQILTWIPPGRPCFTSTSSFHIDGINIKKVIQGGDHLLINSCVHCAEI